MNDTSARIRKFMALKAECIALGKQYLPQCVVSVEDFGSQYEVAIRTAGGVVHAVRGWIYPRRVHPPKWKFWQRPIDRGALIPRDAIAELAFWYIRNGYS